MTTVTVIAHRGGAGLWPENTAAAFAAAAALGLVIETDVRLTSDGVPVCFHDATTARITGRNARVDRLSLAQLREWCAAGDYPLVTVEQLLRDLPAARVVLDLKDARAVGPLAHLIVAHRAAARVCVTGNWDRPLAALRSACGPRTSWGLGWGALGALLTHGWVAGLPAGDGWAFLPAPALRPRVVARAHRLGLRVAVWTVNDVPGMLAAEQAGVDALITDRPDLARRSLTGRPVARVPAVA